MTSGPVDALRRSGAHVLVDDVASPAPGEHQMHHLVRVLRMRDGEPVTVTDGAGAWRRCVLVGGHVDPVGDIERVERCADPVTIGFAVPKHDRPEWIVQKLTELGVARIVLLRAEHSVVRWVGERAVKHVERLRRVAVEAVEQSRGVWLPEIVGPERAVDFLAGAVAAEPGGRALTSGDRVIAVGPEGGWDGAELAAASDLVSISANVLRVETAAVAAGVLAMSR